MNKTTPILLAILLALLAGCSGGPSSVEGLRKAGKKAFLDQKYAEARTYFNKALLKAPSDVDLLYFNGLSYKRDYIYDSALIFIKRADFLQPGNAERNREIYDLARRTENWNYALQAIAVLVKNGEPAEKYYPEMVEYNSLLNQPLLAMYYQRRIVQLDTTKSDELLHLAAIAIKLDSLSVAEGLLDTAVMRFGQSDGILANRGMVAVRRKNYSEAEKIFRGLLAKDTASVGFKLNLANALSMSSDKGKKREALSLYKSLPSEMARQFKVDSLVAGLEKDLK